VIHRTPRHEHFARPFVFNEYTCVDTRSTLERPTPHKCLLSRWLTHPTRAVYARLPSRGDVSYPHHARRRVVGIATLVRAARSLETLKIAT
jgi:hypothetical protein